ncbi:MAG: hypothetical protein RSC99_09205 [Clostridiales bacterium]
MKWHGNRRYCIPCYKKYYSNSLEDRDANVKTLTGKIVQIRVVFCTRCCRYYIDKDTLKTYGKLFLESKDISKEDKTFYHSDFQSDSILSRYGYKAGKEGLPTNIRQSIIANLIEFNKADKYEIEGLLDYFIRFKDCKYAVTDWKDDLLFVGNYGVTTGLLSNDNKQ